MDHVAIDLGSRESQICVRGSKGEIIDEGRCPTRALEQRLKRMPKSRVIVETCAEAFAIADLAAAQGHEVRVVPATLAKTLNVGARGIKTDKRDARALSEVSVRVDLPSVHIPSNASRKAKTLCGMREALVSSRTMLINTVRGWLRGQNERVRTGATETFSARVRAHLEHAGAELPSCVERQLETIDHLNLQIAQADQELMDIAAAHPVCRRLMTVPGIGPVTAVRYVAAIDEPTRFTSAHQLESYLGLTPGEDSSSQRRRRTALTKAGCVPLRACLVRSAWTMRRCRPNDPITRWNVEVEKRRGKYVAVVAMARKLAGILFAIWRDGTVYKPSLAAQGDLHP